MKIEDRSLTLPALNVVNYGSEFQESEMILPAGE
jgi:hypothetical protein